MKTTLLLCCLIASSLAYHHGLLGGSGRRKKRSLPEVQCVEGHAICDAGTVCQSELGLDRDEAGLQVILNAHNRDRAIETGAGNQQELSWNSDLADLAQAWAEQCTFGHGYTNRCDPNLKDCGQNIYYGMTMATNAPYPTFDGEAVVAAWESEKRHFTFGEGCETGEVCGHYTQVVWAKTTEVGCGYAQCPELTGTDPETGDMRVYWPYPSLKVVCNYNPAGNMIGENPYKAGVPCSACKNYATHGFYCTTHTDEYGDAGELCGVCTKDPEDEEYFEPSCECGCAGSDSDCYSCENEGTYNPLYCDCDCKEGFVGDRCEVNCNGPFVPDAAWDCFENSCPAGLCPFADLILSMCIDMFPTGQTPQGCS